VVAVAESTVPRRAGSAAYHSSAGFHPLATQIRKGGLEFGGEMADAVVDAERQNAYASGKLFP
jgi:hypothetical protein